MHTNMDCADAGVNDLLAASLGLTDVVNMGAGEGGNLGRVGNLPRPMTLEHSTSNCLWMPAVFAWQTAEKWCSVSLSAVVPAVR